MARARLQMQYNAVLASHLSCFLLIFLIAGQAYAHRYIPNEGAHINQETAIPIGDIDVSQVVYHTVTPDTMTIWLSFAGKTGNVAKIQLGVPLIEGLESYRPAFALLGPNLPPVDHVPFEIPAGYGGIVYTTDHIVEPEVYDEEFTGTESWTFDMQEIQEFPQKNVFLILL